MIYLVLAAVLWGSSFPVISYALADISPYLFLVLRFSLAFLILASRWRSRRAIRTLFHRDLFLISMPNALSFLLQFKAQEMTTASKAALFVNSTPIWVVIISALFLRAGVARRQMFAMVVALAGVVIVSTRLDFSHFSAINLGDVMCMGTGLLWAVFIVCSVDIVRRYGPYDVAQSLYFWGAILGAPFIFFEPVRFAWAAAPSIVYLALVTTVVAYILYLKGVQSVSPVATSIIILIEVVVAFLIAHRFLGESYTRVEMTGVVLIMAGVVLVVGPRRAPAGPPAESA